MTTFSGHLTDAQAQRVVDGALLGAEAHEVEAHVAGCLECQGLVATYEALGAALSRELEVPGLPDDFTDGVLALVDTRERAVRRERRFATVICAALLVAVATAAVLAGAGGWAPAGARLADTLGATARAVGLGAGVLPQLVSALRLPVALACVTAVLPLLFALSRLMPSPRTEIA